MLEIEKFTIKDLREDKYLNDLPDFYDLKNVVEISAWHNNQTVFDHVVLVYENLLKSLDGSFLPEDFQEKFKLMLGKRVGTKDVCELLKIATLFHDISKNNCTLVHANGTTSSPGHEIIGSAESYKFSAKFELNTEQSIFVSEIIKYHGFAYDILFHVIRTKKVDYYFEIFKKVLADFSLPVLVLFYSDLLGSDYKSNNISGFENLKNLIIELIIKDISLPISSTH